MNSMTLDKLPIGQQARIETVGGEGALRRRLLDMGLIEGTRVSCLQKSPAGDPVAYLIRGAVVALRSEDSSQILVDGLLN